MTLPRLKILQTYWQENPPLADQVATLLAYFGLQIPDSPREEYGTFEDLVNIWTGIGGGFA